MVPLTEFASRSSVPLIVPISIIVASKFAVVTVTVSPAWMSGCEGDPVFAVPGPEIAVAIRLTEIFFPAADLNGERGVWLSLDVDRVFI